MYILRRLLTFKELLLSYALVLFDLKLRFEKFNGILSNKFGLKNTDLREQVRNPRLKIQRLGVQIISHLLPELQLLNGSHLAFLYITEAGCISTSRFRGHAV